MFPRRKPPGRSEIRVTQEAGGSSTKSPKRATSLPENTCIMKLDVNVLRYLSKEDFRVLTAVEMGQKNVRSCLRCYVFTYCLLERVMAGVCQDGGREKGCGADIQ
jgi:hypothetical protein